jgi:outer membrane protein assembly factor BamB
MARRNSPLYLGTNRFVAAIDPQSGEERWRTRLPHGGTGIVAVLVADAHLFVGHAGHAYCLDKRLGSILWENNLPRMGYRPVLLACESGGSRRRVSLYVGTNRFVAALDQRTGAELWRTKLPHSGSAVVSLVVAKACLFVGHAGYLYCLDKRVGSIVWENGLPRMGFHAVIPVIEGAAEPVAIAAAAAVKAEQQRRAAAASTAGGS